MARLKVYATRIGFHDAVVAAPSQKAALAAWDVRENLFAQGSAEVTAEPAAVKATEARPGVVLRRPAGSTDPFSEVPATPQVPKIGRSGRAGPTHATKAKPAPDRRPLEQARQALADYDAEAARKRQDLERRRRDLEAEVDALEREQRRGRRVLERTLERERARYARQGGR